jgi:C4-dicarboxylate-specific signal transduction histidine kinase
MQQRVGMRGFGSVGVKLIALGCAAALGGAAWIARNALDAQRAAFETDARIAHRVLSQRAVQHDAILATLALLQPAAQAQGSVEQRLPALYPQLLRVLRRDAGAAWPTADASEATALAAGEADSRRLQRAALGAVQFAQGRYWLVRAAEPASFALQIDARSLVEPQEWPLPTASPVRAALVHDGQQLLLHEGRLADGRWRFDFAKHLAADSQPFDVTLTAAVGPAALPWRAIALWVAACAALVGVATLAWRQREQARRTLERARLDQVSRLNAMGELAAGIAHELNQPLTAVLANAGAAARLLADDEPDLPTARRAMAQAAAQAQRAGDVLARLRRLIERPDSGAATKAVALAPLLTGAVDLLDAEWRALDMKPHIDVAPADLSVQADPVALQQIVHNLLSNARHALAQVSPAQRQLAIEARGAGQRVALTVRDSGPGIAPEALPRLFEPFFSTRQGGLGLGLSLSESLALGMGGALTASHAEPRGAVFRLELARA